MTNNTNRSPVHPGTDPQDSIAPVETERVDVARRPEESSAAPCANMGESTRNALEAWGYAIGSDRVITDREILERHGRSAIDSRHRAGALLRPRFADEVAEIVRIAARFQVPVHPISTGRNWGYGAASPSVEGGVVLDLSSLQAVRFVDRDLGLVEVEPGVTQGMLYQFLLTQDDRWMTPVHGGGPDCSILGNALERGYGLTPTADHFAALTSIEAVLADGSNYRSAFHALDAPLIGSAHRWGIGPYVEGLFSQGNFGVVTKATFALQRRPQHTEAFFIRLKDDTALEAMVESLRTVLSSLSASVTGVNLMNDRRVLSMSRPYPIDDVPEGAVISDQQCAAMTREAGISRWTLAGILHCPSRMRRPVRRELRRLLPPQSGTPIHFNRRRLSAANSLLRFLPFRVGGIAGQLRSIDALIDLADGSPRRVALPLAYWLRGKSPTAIQPINPAHDGCGLIWYSPLVPMKGEIARSYVDMVDRVCKAHGIEPLITLTSLSDRLMDSTVPILFRPEKPGESQRAQACYEALLAGGRELGCLPYRLSHQSTGPLLADASPGHFDVITKLRQSLDPNNIISPGHLRISAY
ncbi:FAD-binding oxidoreductase [Rubripirellula lacrimiformis]|nr:FAD-binding oxidoreductase [Rubripirellula lacrimiformis]